MERLYLSDSMHLRKVLSLRAVMIKYSLKKQLGKTTKI